MYIDIDRLYVGKTNRTRKIWNKAKNFHRADVKMLKIVPEFYSCRSLIPMHFLPRAMEILYGNDKHQKIIEHDWMEMNCSVESTSEYKS